MALIAFFPESTLSINSISRSSDLVPEVVFLPVNCCQQWIKINYINNRTLQLRVQWKIFTSLPLTFATTMVG